MTKLEWGHKRECFSCHARFYDFQKSPIICPDCGTEYVRQGIGRGRKKDEEDIIEPEDVVLDLEVSDDVVDSDIEDNDDVDGDFSDVLDIADPESDEEI
jgi:hypothetical protein